uniref:Uncharacterized protein n=1 Tax=Rangifer tarandus platyrhynchus TaxID=3082113 RepID=A0ACB0F035_RANTA|nr:unnamed protein product [Rangifer tarandus platyrhynchus]
MNRRSVLRAALRGFLRGRGKVVGERAPRRHVDALAHFALLAADVGFRNSEARILKAHVRYETHVPEKGGAGGIPARRPPAHGRTAHAPQSSVQSPLVTEKEQENPQSAAAREGAVHSVSETRANTKCGVIGGFLIRGPLCGGAEPAAALPSPGFSVAGGPGRRAARAPQRIINRASQGPGQRRPFTPPLLPPGILLFLKTAASWAAEKRQLCGRMRGQAAKKRGSSVSALRAGLEGRGARESQGSSWRWSAERADRESGGGRGEETLPRTHTPSCRRQCREERSEVVVMSTKELRGWESEVGFLAEEPEGPASRGGSKGRECSEQMLESHGKDKGLTKARPSPRTPQGDESPPPQPQEVAAVRGLLRTQRHSESGTNAPVSALAEVPEEARSGRSVNGPPSCPAQASSPGAHPLSPKGLLPLKVRHAPSPSLATALSCFDKHPSQPFEFMAFSCAFPSCGRKPRRWPPE